MPCSVWLCMADGFGIGPSDALLTGLHVGPLGHQRGSIEAMPNPSWSLASPGLTGPSIFSISWLKRPK